jgi:hypothetical protein
VPRRVAPPVGHKTVWQATKAPGVSLQAPNEYFPRQFRNAHIDASAFFNIRVADTYSAH